MRSTQPPHPPPPPPSNMKVGRLLLRERIAAGGMAEVFLALEPRAVGEPRTVVLKRMLPHVASQPGSREMFAEEARLGACVRHDNVVDVFGVEEHGGQPYLILEYVPGVDLWRLCRFVAREGQRLDVPLAVHIVHQLLTALHAVHEARGEDGAPLGIVHRDVSPSNVLLSTHGDVKLGDFGIARRIEQAGQGQGMGGRKGKLGYLSPEQVVGAGLDRRTDVFSAAVIAAELLLGRPLFTGGSELAILLAIRDAKVRPFIERMADLPRGLGEAILSGLARDPQDRASSAADLAARLEPFVGADPAGLRRRLAHLVQSAEGEQSGQLRIHQRPAGLPEIHERLTPVRAPSHIPEEAARASAPPTAEVPTLEYEVETSQGTKIGPFSYAETVEAISTGKIGSADGVRVGGQPPVPVRNVPELARHLPPSTMTSVTREAAEPGMPDEQFLVKDGRLVTILARLALRRETGLLLCEREHVRKEIYAKDGAPEFVTSNQTAELLGESLVSEGLISRGELDTALAFMPRFEGRLGDTLVALELIEPVRLFQHIGAQVRDKLLELFTWKSGTAALYRGVAPPLSAFPLGLDPWEILDAGIERRFEAGLEDSRFRTRMTAAVVQADYVPEEVRKAPLPEAARTVFDMLEKPRMLLEIVDAAAIEGDARRGYRAIVLLLHLDAVRWED